MNAVRTGVIVALAAFGVEAFAQAYPAKPIRAVVPVPAGGYYDSVSRIVTQKLGERLGQTFIVENRVGAGSMTGTAYVATTAPDGYTLLFNGTGGLSIFPSLYAKLPYDPARDFTPIIHLSGVPNILVVTPSLPAKSVRELIALAKTRPGSLPYASNGNGTTQHLSTEMFAVATGTKFTHVPYNGSAPAVTSILGGQTLVLFGVATDVIQQVRAGKLRALAVAAPRRMSVLPDIPTLAEAGVPGIEVEIWLGMFAPRGTPRDIVNRLNTETNRVLEMAEVRERIAPGGIGEAKGGTPEQMAALLQSELAKWAKAVKESGAKVE
jgi:tripartite-type tricarboxylate transporter receptor subunit TctC